MDSRNRVIKFKFQIMKKHVNSPKAFSLIELIVAIALILVLIGLLLVGVDRMIGRSASAQCLANLRIVGSGLMLYVGDNGHFPGALPRRGGVWFKVVHPYVSNETSTDWDKNFPKYMICPSREGMQGEDALGYGYNYLGYGHKPESSGEWEGPSNGYMKKYWEVRLNQIENMDSIVLGDNRDVGAGGYPMFIYNSTGEPSVAHSTRHEMGGHYLYVNNRIEWISGEEIRKRLRQRGRDGANKWNFRPY